MMDIKTIAVEIVLPNKIWQEKVRVHVIMKKPKKYL